MRKVLGLSVALLLIPVYVGAAPFVICAPQAGVAGYEITGLSAGVVNFIAQPDGSLKYDLASLSDGSYEGAAIKPCNMWGCGPATAIAPFVKAVPVAAVGVRIVPE